MRALVCSILLVCACGPPRVWTGLSPDHRTRFDVSRRGDSTCVRVESYVDGCFDAVAVHTITFSPDSRTLAYPVREEGRWHVVRDGQAGPPLDAIGEVVAGPAGRLAYSAKLEGDWYVVTDGRFSEPFDSVLEKSITFDEEGERLAYATRRGRRATVYVNGRVRGHHDDVAALRFAPAGGPLVFVARDGPTASVIVGGRRGPAFDSISAYDIGPRDEVAFIGHDEAGSWAVGPAGASGPFLDARAVTLSGAGTINFVARDAAGERLHYGGVAGPPFAEIEPAVNAMSGRRWGYVGRDSSRSTVMIDGKRHSIHEWAGDLILDPMGRGFAFLSLRNDSSYVVDDRATHGFELVAAGTLQFVSNGCWAALVGRWRNRSLFVVVEGHDERRRFDWWEFTRVVVEGWPARLRDASGTAGLLRAWVGAEAELIVESASVPGRCG